MDQDAPFVSKTRQSYTECVAALTFLEARSMVLREVQSALRLPRVEMAPLGASQGRILAEDIAADRDYPPFDRSVRDGFAVRAGDLLHVLEEAAITHLLVIETGKKNSSPVVRALVSRARLARQMQGLRRAG